MAKRTIPGPELSCFSSNGFQSVLAGGGLRVVLLGKTGSGKSSLGNTLLGRDEFHVARGMSSGTDRCQHASTARKGFTMHVTDTPGVCDTHRSEPEVLKEVGKSLVMASPGPHAIIMVLRCDRRFTKEEYDAYLSLKKMFGGDICHFMLVVFCGVDCFGLSSGADVGESLQLAVETSPEHLKDVMRDAKGRYCGVDNTARWDEREQQAEMLLAKIQELVHDNGGCYLSSKLYEDINKHVAKEATVRMDSDDLTFEEAIQCTKQDVVDEKLDVGFFRKLVDIVGNTILPVLRTVVGDAIAIGSAAVSTYCSVM